MRLPITVSIIHALIVQSGPFEIAFPLNVIKRTLELKRSEICEESGCLTLTLEGQRLRLRTLRQALQLPEPEETDNDLLSIVVCDVGGILLAFIVDRISGQQEIFVRPLRSPLSSLRGLSGATITGDGRVLFVADVSSLRDTGRDV